MDDDTQPPMMGDEVQQQLMAEAIYPVLVTVAHW
jgi:hypothetical protein